MTRPGGRSPGRLRRLPAPRGSAALVHDDRAPIFITLRGGRYALAEPVAFSPQDSGTADAPLIIRAYPNEKPVISGGRRVSGWKAVQVGNRQLWSATVDAVVPSIRQIWVNGQFRHVARHPNSGYLHVAALPDAMPEWDQGQTRFNYREGDLLIGDLGPDARVVTMTRWVESHLPIASIDQAQHLFNFKVRNTFRLDVNDPYYIENALALLDAPGEWYFDAARRTLYYLPMPGEDVQQAEVIVPALQQVLILQGNPDKDQTVHHVEFQGITFSHTGWDFTFPANTPPEKIAGGFSQASIPITAAVIGTGLRNFAFERCTFEHIGNWALQLAGGCQRNRIDGCTFVDLGAGGIKLGEEAIREKAAEQTFANRIAHCTLATAERSSTVRWASGSDSRSTTRSQATK